MVVFLIMYNLHDYHILDSFGGLANNSLRTQLEPEPTWEHDTPDEYTLPESVYYSPEQFSESFSTVNPNEKDMTIVSLNCQSLRSKYEQIRLFLLSNCDYIDILILQETWLGIHDDTSYLNIEGYNFFSQPSRISKHGGLAIYIKTNLTHKHITTVNSQSLIFESLFFEISLGKKHKKIIIGNIYRPPRDIFDNYETFTTELTDIMGSFSNNNTNIIIGGDFNINLLKLRVRPIFHEFLETVFSNAFIPQITIPSRFSERSCSLLDNFFTKLTENSINSSSGAIISGLSDHLPIFIKLDLKIKNCTGTHNFTYERSQTAETNFILDISRTQIMNKLDSTQNGNPCLNYHILNNEISKLLEQHLKKKRVKTRHYKHKKTPWVTCGIINSIKYRDKLYKNLKSTSPDSPIYNTIKTNYNTYQQILRKMIREAKTTHYRQYFSKFQSNTGKTWQKINEIIGKGKNKSMVSPYFLVNGELIDDEHEIAERFNNFFTSIAASNIELDHSSSPLQYLKNRPTSSFKFHEITSNDILKITEELSGKQSSGHDNLSTALLKQIINIILPEVTLIFNQMVVSSIFPNDLKIAKVIPIYKKENPQLLNNYRPIALLPAISKIFEKALAKQIYDYFTYNSIIYESQYGFRPLHSTQMAALELSTRISEQLDCKKTPINFYLDLSKAFDVLDHQTLLAKLTFYGFDISALKLCENYLKNRKQYVEINGKKSSLLPVTAGVPQGSILGPLLFIIFINDLPNVSKIFKCIIYADDTTLCATIEDFDQENTKNQAIITDNINRELDKINYWLKCNKLKLNTNKTKFMCFRPRSKQRLLLDLTINNSSISQVFDFNFLGIVFDEQLSWKMHVNNLSIKMNRAIGVINRLKNHLPTHILKLVYFSLIHSHLCYGIHLWCYTPLNKNKILALQKKSVRTITFSKKHEHSKPLFSKLNILGLDELIKLHELKFYYNLFHNNVPGYFKKIVTPFRRNENYNTRLGMILNPIHCRLTLVSNTFRAKLPNTINSLEHRIIDKVNTHSLQGITRYYKRHLALQYTNPCSLPNCYSCQQSRLN